MGRKQTNIRRRGKSWVVHHRANGKQHWQSFKTREDAELELSKVLAKRAKGEPFAPPAKISFAELASEYLRDYAQSAVRATTFNGYEIVLRVHLIPEFGHLPVGAITRKQVDVFVADWLAGGPRYQERVRSARELEAERAHKQDRKPRAVRLGRSPKSIGNAIGLLHGVFAQAVEWGYRESNPVSGIKRPEREHREMRILDAEQVQRFLAAAGPEWYAFFLTAVTTGARLGELLGLKWQDLDTGAQRLAVRRGVDRQGNFVKPKSKRSVRRIAITPTLLSTLRHHRMASPYKAPEDLLFPNRRGAPLDGVNLSRRQFKDTLRRAGLPEMRFHDLRHTYASLLIAQGAHAKLISEQLGHAGIQITLDRYGHLMDQSYDDASDALEKSLFGGQPASRLQAPDRESVPQRSSTPLSGTTTLA